MKTSKILDTLFFINYELKFDEIDRYFEKMRFRNTAREESILCFIDNDSSDANGISSFTMNISDQKVLNCSYKTNKEIDLDTLQTYAQTRYNFYLEQESENIIIFKKDNLNLHFRKLIFPESEFSQVLYHISLFEPLINSTSELAIMPPSI